MQKLIRGLHHYQTLAGSQQELFDRLAKGQHPEALFITCSDSRINPNLITQTDPGDLFILRNAGNLVPPYGAARGGEAPTIEFAVAGLKIRDIIVCGHSQCGAMSALLEPEKLTDLPAMRNWIEHAESTRRIVRENYAGRTGAALLTTTVEENVLVQLDNLRTHPVVATGLARRDLTLHGWVYKIETGEVFYYDAEQEQFLSVNQGSPKPLPLPKRIASEHAI